jgi:hypothetical protein
LQSVEIHSRTFSKWCVGKRGRIEEFSVAPLRNKRVKPCVAVGEKRVQTENNYKLMCIAYIYFFIFRFSVNRNSDTCAFSVRTHGIVPSSFTARNISEIKDISLLIKYLFSGHNISELKHTSY